jgi:hypothetical protein
MQLCSVLTCHNNLSFLRFSGCFTFCVFFVVCLYLQLRNTRCTVVASYLGYQMRDEWGEGSDRKVLSL